MEVLQRAHVPVARLIDRPVEEILFTPSASAALWVAVQDAIGAAPGRRLNVLASRIEHPALLKNLRDAERDGRIRLTLLPADHRGQPDLDELRRLCRDGADLVCMMVVNNELGSIAPIAEVLAIARESGARTLVDASQAGGRLPLGARLASADYVVLSGAKMYGPRAGVLCGRLIARTREGARAIFGTPDVAAAAAMALACELREREMQDDEQRIGAMRDRLQAMLTDGVPGLVVNGDPDGRIAGALHVSSPGIPGEAVVARLHGRVDVSTGAACQSGTPGHSHVLTAIGMSESRADGAVRICVGKFNTSEEIEDAADAIARAMTSSVQAARRRA